VPHAVIEMLKFGLSDRAGNHLNSMKKILILSISFGGISRQTPIAIEKCAPRAEKARI
jgi:hypothetical protein